MKSRFLPCAAACAVGLLATSVRADDAKDALVRAQQAQLAAPMCRITINTTEPNSAKKSQVLVETVGTNQMHMRQEQDGKVTLEIFTDGQKTMMRRGADGPVVQAPPALNAMLSNVRRAGSLQAMAESAKDVRVAGHDVVDGQTATIYTFTADNMGVHSQSKLWISDKDALPLKAEGDSTGGIDSQNSAGVHAPRHSTIVFSYDPAITINLPTAG